MMKITQTILVSFVIIGLGGCATPDEQSKSSGNKCTRTEGANIMYKKLTTNMMVEDVSYTVDFYSDVLGFQLVMAVPENSQEIVTKRQKGQILDFAIVKCGEVEIMFQARKSLSQEIPEFNGMEISGSLTFYIEVQDVKGLYEELKDKVTIVKDMQTKFYGKQEFYIRDCNGYVLGFAGAL